MADSPRQAAALAVIEVTVQGRSLTAALTPLLQRVAPAERGLAQELAYGTLRWYPRLQALLRQLLQRPLKKKDRDIEALLLIGLYQLAYLNIPGHAAVSETVATTDALDKGWAKGLVNAILRNFQRRRETLEATLATDEAAALAHPPWLLQRLRTAWPDQWPAIVEANNQRPPMTLRVNARHGDRDRYLARLAEAGIAAHPAPHTEQGITLESAVAVERLPGFAAGEVSVQDGAAQLAAQLLDAPPDARVLDACAAPGGKSAHLLERGEEIALTALDNDPQRLARVGETLQRLGLQARTLTGDAAQPAQWWDGAPFDRILLDAPCSATGVIRRHPDIKLLRREEDIAALVQTQAQILHALWPLLRPGGMLVYATCSVLPDENAAQVDRFLQTVDDARTITLNAEWGRPAGAGRQILPGEDGMDGFFYACLGKR